MVSKNLKILVASLTTAVMFLGASAIYNKGVKNSYNKGYAKGCHEGLRRGLISGETNMFLSAMNYYDKNYIFNNQVQYVGIEPHAERIEMIIENLQSKNIAGCERYEKVRKRLFEK